MIDIKNMCLFVVEKCGLHDGWRLIDVISKEMINFKSESNEI